MGIAFYGQKGEPGPRGPPGPPGRFESQEGPDRPPLNTTGPPGEPGYFPPQGKKTQLIFMFFCS